MASWVAATVDFNEWGTGNGDLNGLTRFTAYSDRDRLNRNYQICR